MDSQTDIEAAPKESSKFTKGQKLAALLLMLDPDNATHIMKQLNEQELEATASEMTKFTTLSQQLQTEILDEFSSVALEAGTAITVRVENVQGLLEKSVGLYRASGILSHLSAVRPPAVAMQRIIEMDVRHIFNQLRYEQPQTIAMVASYLTAEKASQLFSLMRPEVRDQVIERLATMSPTSVEVMESVVEVLHQKFANHQAIALNQTGGVKATAEVLNALPKSVSKSVIVSLEERNAELCKAVLKKMYSFEDLERLDVQTLQKILKEVDMRTLSVSLKTASEKLSTLLLSAISKRAAESVREEISFLGPLKLREIEAAQSEIIAIVRRLEAEGEIDSEESGQTARS